MKIRKCYLILGTYFYDTDVVLGVFIDRSLALKNLNYFRDKYNSIDNIRLEMKLLYYV